MQSTRTLLLLMLIVMPPVNATEAPVFEGPQSEIDSILNMFQQWESARASGDTNAVAALYHEDMLIMTRGRSLLEGRAGAKVFYSENYTDNSDRELNSSMMELRVFGEIAIVTGQFLVRDDNQGIEDPGYYLIILRKDSVGNWRIYRDIDTPSFLGGKESHVEGGEIELMRSTEEEKVQQVENVESYRSVHEGDAEPLLGQLQETARKRENTFEALMEAGKVCSLGSMSHALYEVGGEYRRNM